MKPLLRNTLIITGGIAAAILGLYFFVAEPRSRNFSKYTEYQLIDLQAFKDTYGENPKSWSLKTFDEWERISKEHMCLDRYMSDNYPFAEAVTNCKQESSIP